MPKLQLTAVVLVVAICATSLSWAAEPATVTVKSFADTAKLTQAQAFPPLPDWLAKLSAADPDIVGAVALPDGRWVLERREHLFAWDDLRDLYVSGFGPETKPEQLKTLFEEVGPVQDVSVSRSVGLEHGKAYDNCSAKVRMETVEAARQAETKLMDSQWEGHKLYVKAKDDTWVTTRFIQWHLYDSDGNEMAPPHHAHGTGWEDWLWPDGYYDTLMDTGLIKEDEKHVVNWTQAGPYVFIFDRAAPGQPILRAYDASNGELLFDAAKGGECVLPVPRYRYCMEIKLRPMGERNEITNP